MRLRRDLIAAAAMLTAACHSPVVNVAPLPPAEYERLGVAEAEACGDLYLILPWHQFVPRGLNERVERAYEGAVASVPGATGLVNVTLQERWYWWGLASHERPDCNCPRGEFGSVGAHSTQCSTLRITGQRGCSRGDARRHDRRSRFQCGSLRRVPFLA